MRLHCHHSRPPSGAGLRPHRRPGGKECTQGFSQRHQASYRNGRVVSGRSEIRHHPHRRCRLSALNPPIFTDATCAQSCVATALLGSRNDVLYSSLSQQLVERAELLPHHLVEALAVGRQLLLELRVHLTLLRGRAEIRAAQTAGQIVDLTDQLRRPADAILPCTRQLPLNQVFLDLYQLLVRSLAFGLVGWLMAPLAGSDPHFASWPWVDP